MDACADKQHLASWGLKQKDETGWRIMIHIYY